MAADDCPALRLLFTFMVFLLCRDLGGARLSYANQMPEFDWTARRMCKVANERVMYDRVSVREASLGACSVADLTKTLAT